MSPSTKTRPTGLAPEPTAPEPTAPEPPTPDERVARRMLDWHGDSLIDIYTDLVRRADESAGADRTDPYSSYGGYSTWLRSRRQWCRERAELVARLDLLAALRDGGRPAPPDEDAVARAAARELVALYCRVAGGGLGRLVAAARRQEARALAERAEIADRLTTGTLYDPGRGEGWSGLRDLLAREQELVLAMVSVR